MQYYKGYSVHVELYGQCVVVGRFWWRRDREVIGLAGWLAGYGSAASVSEVKPISGLARQLAPAKRLTPTALLGKDSSDSLSCPSALFFIIHSITRSFNSASRPIHYGEPAHHLRQASLNPTRSRKLRQTINGNPVAVFSSLPTKQLLTPTGTVFVPSSPQNTTEHRCIAITNSPIRSPSQS